jgi:hypothetical protein
MAEPTMAKERAGRCAGLRETGVEGERMDRREGAHGKSALSL